MEYLKDKFTVGVGSAAFKEGWDRIFGKKMSPEEKEAQRQSFAYGNTNLGNPQVTRELVAEQASIMEQNEEKMTLPKPDTSTPQTINEWMHDVHETAISKGWYEGVPENSIEHVKEKLLLLHSEVSEATEDFRVAQSRGDLNNLKFKTSEGTLSYVGTEGDGTPRKPVGFPSEMADIVIRVLDLCAVLGIDLESAMIFKSRFNKTRPHRHGGKNC